MQECVSSPERDGSCQPTLGTPREEGEGRYCDSATHVHGRAHGCQLAACASCIVHTFVPVARALKRVSLTGLVFACEPAEFSLA